MGLPWHGEEAALTQLAQLAGHVMAHALPAGRRIVHAACAASLSMVALLAWKARA